MTLFASFLMRLEMLRRNKLRGLLTMLIAMISGGFQRFIKGEFEKIGSRTVFVM